MSKAMSAKSISSRSARTAALLAAADERILVLDGATGTALQNLDLKAADFGGPELEGCNENLVLVRPDIVAQVHDLYLEAGADIVETNTFGATPIVLDEYALGHKTYEINKRAAEIAREACARFDAPGKLRFVAGSIGPTTKSLSLTGGITFEGLIDHYYEQVRGLFDGGTDYFLIETCNDTRNVKTCLLAIDRLFEERGEKIPIAVSATIESTGTMLAGQSVEALTAALMHRELLYLGLNCATGPEFMTDHIRSLAKLSPFRIACVPNAGLPDEDGRYLETPDMVAKTIGHFVEKGWINFIGGCCGTHAGHVHALVETAKKAKPRNDRPEKRSLLSGVDHLEITDELRPVIVGERTNVIGSRKFKDLIKAGKFDEAAEIARAQVKSGAHIIDVCLADSESDEVK
ncbi:MAG: homocysteine S-methyltransferase family protein, partial [Bdellovibrionota bacterium]